MYHNNKPTPVLNYLTNKTKMKITISAIYQMLISDQVSLNQDKGKKLSFNNIIHNSQIQIAPSDNYALSGL